MTPPPQPVPQHFVLAPHADDAALSCGGQIAALVREGQPVTIITLLIGQPSPAALRLPLAHYFHQKWGLADNVIAVRRAEDQRAAARLGASLHFGDLLEAGYRQTADGAPCYAVPEAIHQAPHPRDPLLQLLTPAAVLAQFQALPVNLTATSVIHAPLGVGNHVDHQTVRQMALLLTQALPDLKVFFYEDYPYASWNDQVVPAALRALTGLAAPRPLSRVVHALDLRSRLTRIAAIAAYQSQLKMIWRRGAVGMALRTWQFMSRAGGEVEWELV